jgi:hypothetical protein
MSKYSWLKSPLIPTGILVVVAIIILACSDEYIINYPASFFAPEVTHNDKYSEFFRSYHFLYTDSHRSDYNYDYYKENNFSDFNKINISEWETYFQNHIQNSDLNYILYNARLGEVDTLIFSIKKQGYPISNRLEGNSILKYKDTRSALDFLYYIGYAKRCEKYSTYEPDDWYYDRTVPDTNDPRSNKDAMAALADGGLKQLTNTKSDFVRQRYAFQVLRLYYMSKDFDKCIQFYADQKKVFESAPNAICYRAMGYLAGAYYGEKKYSNADYIYSLIYDEYDTMKTTAFFSFHPQEESDWNQTLAMAKNTREKVVLWQMLGIYDDPLRAMKEIYALDPKSDVMDLLLARAVNTEEENFIYQSGEYNDSYNTLTDSTTYIRPDSVNKELVDFFKIVADKGNTAKPYEWDLAAGYLDWAMGDNGFQKYLDKAKTECNGDSLVIDEIRLVRLLNMVNTGKAGDKKFEENVVPEINWLYGNHPADFRGDVAQDFIQFSLTKKYKAIGDTVISVCISGQLDKDRPHFRTFLNELRAFMDKKNKTDFEVYALDMLKYDDAVIQDMQALKPFYEHHFKEALAIISDIDYKGDSTYADPFIIHIKDCHDCDFDDKKQKKYTKKDFIKKMISLEDSVKSSPANAAKIYFLLANGFYNMSYFGNCRKLYVTKLTGVSDDYFGEDHAWDTSEIDDMHGYMSCNKAREYYNKALAASNDPEYKTKCEFMAAKCSQNNSYVTDGGVDNDSDSTDYFNVLMTSYSKTKYYRDIIKECGYFKKYVESNK